MTSPVVHSDPEILGGTPVFVGTRVPVKNLRLSRGGRLIRRFLELLSPPSLGTKRSPLLSLLAMR